MLPLNHILQNRYRILCPLGKGGMGNVYEAMDEAVECIVAIKETFAASDKLRRAFEREAKLLANLRHPALPRVTHHFVEGEGQFLVMDYIEGLDLLQLLALRKHPFRVEELLPEADKLLGALHYLHTRSEPIIHRDIKPANIKRTSKGEIYLLDFGLAKGSAGQMARVEPGESFYSSVYGYTAAYAPLEQLTNAGTNAQSDLYGLGATLYHLFTGHAPLSANVRYEALEMGAVDPLPKIHQVNSQIPERVSDVISHAMAMSRRDRTRTASEMRKALLEASRGVQGPLDAQLPSTLVPQFDVSPPAGERLPKEPEKSDHSVPQITQMSPTIGSPAGVVPVGRGGQHQSTMSVPPPVAVRTIVPAKHAVIEPVWKQPIALSLLTAEQPKSSAAKIIIIICGAIAVFFVGVLVIFVSSMSKGPQSVNMSAPASQTTNSNSTSNKNLNRPVINRPPNAEVYVDTLNMAKDDNDKPGASTTTFAPSDRKIHCVINLNKIKGGTRIRTVWIAADVKGIKNQELKTLDYTTNSFEKKITGYLTWNGDWPKGQYRLEVYINGALDKTIDYTIG